MMFLSTYHVKDRESNRNSHNIGLIKAIICAGLYPNVAIIRNVKKTKRGDIKQKIFTPEDGAVTLHIRSINSNEAFFEGKFLVYHLKMKTSKVFLHDTTMVFALPLIFFGHNFELFRENGMVVIELSPKIRFTCAASTALLVKELRQRLDQLLEYKVAHPGVTDWDSSSDEGKLLRAIAELISHEDEKLSMVDESDDDEYEDEEEDFPDNKYPGNHPRSYGSSHSQAGPSRVTPFPRW
uniref:Uncharacterized protein n=1 Tax=Graphocephala atropunctata TaxID=36148 RepID=A0A1B6MDH7_9HEMI